MSNDNDDDLSNSGPLTKDLLTRQLGALGRAYGKGANSRPAAAILAVEAAHKLPDVGPDQAPELWEKFQREAAKSKGIEYKVEASAKQQVSKFRQVLTLGANPRIDGYQVMLDGVDVIKDLAARDDNPLRGSAYDNMILVARRANKAFEENGRQLSKDEIHAILTEEKPEATNVEKVIDLYKRIYRLQDDLVKDGVDVGNLGIALEAVGDQIEVMDGKLPPMTKDEREKAKALEVIERNGMIVSPRPMPTLAVAAFEAAE